jgi:hypothetical protein
MEHLTEIILAIFASTGFWACVQAVILKHMDRRSAERAALLGLLHERLVDQCEVYLDKGYISEGQYRDLDEYIYKPYRNLGGNGTGEEYMKRVQELIFKRKEREKK